MSKIERVMGTTILPHIVEYANEADFGKRIKIRLTIEERLAEELAPTLALMEKLAYHLDGLHRVCQCDGHCPTGSLLTDYEAWKKEQG